MFQTAHDAYLESRIESAGPVQLIGLLYQAAVSAIRDARRHLAASDIAARSRAVSNAMEILTELTTSLDRTGGGEIAFRLAQLYDYMQRRLLEANSRQADAPLAEVLGLLTTLSEAWHAIAEEPRPVERAAGAWSQMAGEPGSMSTHAWSL